MGIMIAIPAGEFVMGISAEQAENFVREFFQPQTDVSPYLFFKEVPQHTVKVESFEISKLETTNQEFQEFVDSGGYQNSQFWKELLTIEELNTDFERWERIKLFQDRSGKPGPATWTDGRFPEGKGNEPVEGVSWFEATAYCRWKNLRLPSEAEWEYAARGRDRRTFAWGDNKDLVPKPPQGQKTELKNAGSAEYDVSPFGVMDLSGNVSEWVDDVWHPYPNSPIGELKKVDPSYGITRGGNYLVNAAQYRVTYRQREARLTRSIGLGFRCAR
jgi:gamma-glutamyl hercynylcysteine S-oxide synthase